MPIHSFPLADRRGPILQVEISIADSLAAYNQKHSLAIPSPISGSALIDTGATFTAVDQSVLDRLQVSPVEPIGIHTAAGAKTYYRYPATLSFPGTGLPSPPFAEVTGCPLDGSGIVCLLGRDFLEGVLMVYDGNSGMITLAW